jgi:V/A-type H+-transporting ATPase subunit A
MGPGFKGNVEPYGRTSRTRCLSDGSPAIISNYYSRAGFVELSNGKTGSITFIGTVSPRMEEISIGTCHRIDKKSSTAAFMPFHSKIDSKRYPAIDPIESYSKYLDTMKVKDYITEKHFI